MSELKAVLEYNDKGVTLWAAAYPGAFARGKTAEEASKKLPSACRRFRLWAKLPPDATSAEGEDIRCVQKIRSDAALDEGFTTALFSEEKLPMDMARYTSLKSICLISARDFETLFASIPQKDRALLKSRRTAYGKVPVTSREMMAHVLDEQCRYASLFGISLGGGQGLLADRKRLFTGLEARPDFLSNRAFVSSDGELWSMRKLLRRLLWHDAIHGRALYRKAISFWQKEQIKNPFGFSK